MLLIDKFLSAETNELHEQIRKKVGAANFTVIKEAEFIKSLFTSKLLDRNFKI